MENTEEAAQLDTALIASEIADAKSGSLSRKLSLNAVASLIRVAINCLVALLLPAYLTHRLPVEIYGVWVLILQMGAYISFLDFGAQTGVAKFVAEFDARGDRIGAGHRASAGLAMMLGAAAAGILLTLGVVWQVPRLFGQIPTSLHSQVRISIAIMGVSLSFGLVCAVYSAVFIGLQRYVVPTGIAIANRIFTALVIALAVFSHRSIVIMSLGVGLVNVLTGGLQIVAWRRMARSVLISLRGVDREAVRQVLSYCVVLAVWSVSALCVSGLDVTVIGHWAFRDTPYYSLATLPTNLIILVISSVLAPFMPAASALSTQRTPEAMGNLLSQSTRYTTLLLLLTGLPLLVFGRFFLTVWVGPVYATHGIRMLQILVLATIVRNLCLPYSIMVLAIGKQKVATAATIGEAVVNLASSIYLAQRLGGVGVAAGTLVGACVSVFMHFGISMRYTSSNLQLSRYRLVIAGMLRPASIALPTLLFTPKWWNADAALNFPFVVLWIFSTLTLSWLVGINSMERVQLLHFLRRKLGGKSDDAILA
jgi:O-antigen/teichoic acid export membrane protein